MSDSGTDMKRRLAVTMACHNRRELTLKCLRSLFSQTNESLSIEVHLFDDGSTDDTRESVLREFSAVTVIQGDGSAFWGGGMHGAMNSALSTDFDDILWLNDDVALDSDALTALFSAQLEAKQSQPPTDHIIVGALREPNLEKISYGGYRRRSWIDPHGTKPA
ncbi:MAG: glycosyltransferase, partial [Pseudomonadota bacterium]